MNRTQIGVFALFLFAGLAIATLISTAGAQATPEELRALTALKRATCLADARIFEQQLACQRLTIDSAWIMPRLAIAGALAFSALMTLGYALAMLARPAGTPAPEDDLTPDQKREQARYLALQAQHKLREEREQAEKAARKE